MNPMETGGQNPAQSCSVQGTELRTRWAGMLWSFSNVNLGGTKLFLKCHGGTFLSTHPAKAPLELRDLSHSLAPEMTFIGKYCQAVEKSYQGRPIHDLLHNSDKGSWLIPEWVQAKELLEFWSKWAQFQMTLQWICEVPVLPKHSSVWNCASWTRCCSQKSHMDESCMAAVLWSSKNPPRFILKEKMYSTKGCFDFSVLFNYQCQQEDEKLRVEYQNPLSVRSFVPAHLWTNCISLPLCTYFSVLMISKYPFFSVWSVMERGARGLLDRVGVTWDRVYRPLPLLQERAEQLLPKL